MNAIHAAIRDMGAAFSPAQVQASIGLFAPLLPAVEEEAVVRDVRYGDDPRHRLDLFGANRSGALRPVVVFVHGGGFVGGDKGNAGTPFYSNVGAWAASNEWLGVTMTYRLAPDHPWPAGAEDVARAIAWLRAEAQNHGGDPRRIVLMGQSAGAAHVASYVGGTAHAAIAAESLAGAIMLSGLYDVASADRNLYQDAYYGDDAGRYAAQSSIAGLATTPVPCLFTVAEYDPADFQRQGAQMIARWVLEKNAWPDFHRLQGQNHITPVHQIGTAVDEVGPLLVPFITRVTARDAA